MKTRCAWCPADNPLYIEYHDKEWGVPVHDDRHLFEMLPNANFWLNPLSECQKPLPESEVALLMSGQIFARLRTAAHNDTA